MDRQIGEPRNGISRLLSYYSLTMAQPERTTVWNGTVWNESTNVHVRTGALKEEERIRSAARAGNLKKLKHSAAAAATTSTVTVGAEMSTSPSSNAFRTLGIMRGYSNGVGSVGLEPSVGDVRAKARAAFIIRMRLRQGQEGGAAAAAAVAARRAAKAAAVAAGVEAEVTGTNLNKNKNKSKSKSKSKARAAAAAARAAEQAAAAAIAAGRRRALCEITNPDPDNNFPNLGARRRHRQRCRPVHR